VCGVGKCGVCVAWGNVVCVCVCVCVCVAWVNVMCVWRGEMWFLCVCVCVCVCVAWVNVMCVVWFNEFVEVYLYSPYEPSWPVLD